ncbi:MAG: WbuC family cupin fold metalloprotein [Burkholderiales bacterium]|nr:WbuC family cupin fold metalloprotein [Burkholderiales bacterium]
MREAQAAPRRRKNRNFHAGNDAHTHRLLNALEPDSYVQPHRHLDPAKDETIVALCGAFGVVLFDTHGEVVETGVIAPDGDSIGIDIAHGRFHTVLALKPGSVFFEAKAGPYVPIAESERAAWAPPEGDPAAVSYLARLRSLFA